jgi:hypothetical protein
MTSVSQPRCHLTMALAVAVLVGCGTCVAHAQVCCQHWTGDAPVKECVVQIALGEWSGAGVDLDDFPVPYTPQDCTWQECGWDLVWFVSVPPPLLVCAVVPEHVDGEQIGPVDLPSFEIPLDRVERVYMVSGFYQRRTCTGIL